MVELRRGRTKLRVSLTLWTLSLELARLAGWSPAGTRRITPDTQDPVDELENVRHLMGWQNEYRSSDGQTVSNTDAMQLVISLDQPLQRGDAFIQDLISGKIAPVTGIHTDALSFSWFTTPEGKIHLQNLIDFCRGGSFEIF